MDDSSTNAPVSSGEHVITARSVPTPWRRSRTRGITWLLIGMSLLLGLIWISQAASIDPSFSLLIDGDEVISGENASVAQRFLIAGVACLLALGALLLAGVLVPLALLFAGIALVFGLVMGLGLPVLMVAGVVLLLLSPLLFIVWLIWKLAQT